jgi:membrane-bound metal-dependent hydrolase YbcI (DUF457 family)
MLFWFIGTACIAVWYVFRDDRFDYRVLALGAILPDIVDVWSGGAWFMHSIVTSVIVLGVVMAVARRGTVRRRRWLALPIGLFMHLVFDGVFNNTTVFWWPLGGVDLGGANIPSFDRMGLNVVFEFAGLAMLAWLWRLNGLGSATKRAQFIRTGHLVGGTETEVGKC